MSLTLSTRASYQSIWLAILSISILLIQITSSFIDDLPLPLYTIPLNQSRGFAVEGTVNRRNRRLTGTLNKAEVTPLYEGLGTHYSHLWVGTPPQRVSVIVDTGSHHTAFPCTGCKCGKHIDPFFDPVRSSSSKVQQCGGKRCIFRQSYSEGSSWSAFRVTDKVWLGSNDRTTFNTSWDLSFSFGCQESETGLFRTQKVDGIMGMCASEATIPYLLMAQGITTTKIFAMCFRQGGGILTLGGVDQTLHNVENSLEFAGLTKSKGWFTVVLLDILMKDPKTGKIQSIGGDKTKYNGGKGTIVDSGTTDTYIPRSLAPNFRTMYKLVSGMEHSNSGVSLSPAQHNRLPVIIYRLEGLKGGDSKSVGVVDIECTPYSYMEKSPNKALYSNRIYLTEPSGTVLGANFMNNHNVVFDIDGLKLGFAKAKCT